MRVRLVPIKVNTDSVEDAQRRATSELEKFERALEEMRLSVDALNATWQGGNHDAFVKTFEERYAQMVEVKKLISGFLNNIKKATQDYEQCETEVLSLASF